jgi:hypothetical protein
VLYLLDANVLITANNQYYPIDQVPEFWNWLQHQGKSGRVKIPVEVMDEIEVGRKGDLLLDWINGVRVRDELLLEETVDVGLVQRVVYEGYGTDLTDTEIEELGRDPFLVAYALATPDRCVVTSEVSKPSTKRQNRRIPDVCASFSVACCGPFQLNRALGFHTAWKPS